MANRFSVEAIFKAIDKVSAPVSAMQNNIGKMTRSINAGLRSLDNKLGKVTASMKKVGFAALASMALVGTAFADVVGTGAEFEQTLVNAAAKFPGEIKKGTDAFKRLEDAARKTGATTQFTATQSAQALNYLAMAGFNADQSVAALPGVVDLATAAQVDLATASDIATDSLGAFGLMTNDAAKLGMNLARVNDVMAKTATTSNTNMEMMMETIKQGGPVATSAGASLETFLALTGALANSGIKASDAGTTLKNVFIRLSAPVGASAKMLRKLGIRTKDSHGNLRDITDIIGELNKSLSKLGTADKAAALNAIFGKIPIAGVNILLKTGSKALKDYRAQLEAASGASSNMAATMRDTVEGRIKSLQSAIEGVKISVFNMVKGPLAEVIDKTVLWIRTNQELITSKIGGFLLYIINNFDSIVTWLKRIGIAITVFLIFTAILKTFIMVMTALNLVMALNPIVLIAMGVIALIAAMAVLIVYSKEVYNWFVKLPLIAKALLGPLGIVIFVITKSVNLIKEGIDYISKNWDKITGFFGFGDGDQTAQKGAAGAQVVSPQARTASAISETNTTTTSEVTIKDQTGRAEVTKGSMGPNLQLVNSGNF